MAPKVDTYANRDAPLTEVRPQDFDDIARWLSADRRRVPRRRGVSAPPHTEGGTRGTSRAHTTQPSVCVWGGGAPNTPWPCHISRLRRGGAAPASSRTFKARSRPSTRWPQPSGWSSTQQASPSTLWTPKNGQIWRPSTGCREHSSWQPTASLSLRSSYLDGGPPTAGGTACTRADGQGSGCNAHCVHTTH